MTTEYEHDRAKRLAIEHGCTPKWCNGILGYAWHCGCPGDDDSHFIDQQCSVVRWYRKEEN